jgi:hypothetical protein
LSRPARPSNRSAVGAVELWWPNAAADASLGSHAQDLPALRPIPSQPLYPLTLTITLPPSHFSPLQSPAISDSRNIGFRAFALVTDDDSDPQRLRNMSGSGNVTMRFKVNGVPVWARGSNAIPLDEFSGRSDAAALMQQMRSAAAAGMNMLLLWGGGIWQHTAFYEEADRLGLMIYHDLMYSAQGHMAHMLQPTANQALEIAHQVARLSCHPSIVIWASGNEIGGGALYASFGLENVRAVDCSRALWPASPSRSAHRPLPLCSMGARSPCACFCVD